MTTDTKSKAVEKEALVPSVKSKEIPLLRGIGLEKDCHGKGMFGNKITLKVVGKDVFAIVNDELSKQQWDHLNSLTKKEENK